MWKFTIIKSGVFHRCVGSSSKLLLLFSCYDFRASSADTIPNSHVMFLHVLNEYCLNAFDVIVKHGDIIENIISMQLPFSLFDVILARMSSFISTQLSSSLMNVIMWNDDFNSRLIASFAHLLHFKSSIVVESHDSDLSSSCDFFVMIRFSSHAIMRDNHMIRNGMILLTAFSTTPFPGQWCSFEETFVRIIKRMHENVIIVEFAINNRILALIKFVIQNFV